MLRIHEIKLGLDESLDVLPDKVRKKMNQPQLKIQSFSIFKESIDARNKEDIKFVYSLDFQVKDEAALLKNATKLRIEQVEVYAKTNSHMNDKAHSPVNSITNSPVNSITNSSVNSKDDSSEKPTYRPVIVGFGPCGMFSALRLAELGYRPIVLERGKALDDRANDVQVFWSEGILNPESNVAFGEGGAGAFSDGKLTTQIKDPRVRKVLEELVRAGGPADILYKQKPHIGTDILRSVVIEIRKRIIACGGEVRFQSKLSGVSINEASEKNDISINEASEKNGISMNEVSGKNGQRTLSLKINNQEEIVTQSLILAIGHSARDTFHMLHEAGLEMAQKPFSIGVRVEHPQKVIDEAQYGSRFAHPRLGAADYKLSHHCQDGRGVYTFCMCPGGLVIGAASEASCLVTNGMSYHSRAADNANSAVLVDVLVSDFPSSHPLAGIAFQRQWEKEAFILGGSNYKAPAQKMGDFLAGNSESRQVLAGNSESRDVFAGNSESRQGSVKASFKPGVRFTDISACLPDFALRALKEAIPELGKKLYGFDDSEAVLTAIETRSSSPVRILRDGDFCGSIFGIYPAGEGAGYAGGIISAAVDGLKAAEAVHASLKNR